MDIYINFDRAAPDRLIEYAAERGLTAFTLVADKNTFAALGRRVEAALRAADLAVEVIVLPGDVVVPDEGRIVHILMRASVQTCYLAVGSGVITDLTRFVSYHTRNRFISLPTAPSMDGYATSSNALTIGGLKQSIAGQAPEAIFCDIGTLAAAPRPLIAAGLGDTLAKFTSVNDLRLGHLLWDERWDEAIGQRMEDLAHAALARADEIARADADAVALLTRSLIDSGLEMAAFGSSAPGGGSEHHISHCWEMRMLQAGQPALLHGLKVGVGTVIAAGWYACLREMSRDEAARRLAGASLPDADARGGDHPPRLRPGRRPDHRAASAVPSHDAGAVVDGQAACSRPLGRCAGCRRQGARAGRHRRCAAERRRAGDRGRAGPVRNRSQDRDRLRPLHPAAFHHRQAAAAPGIVN